MTEEEKNGVEKEGKYYEVPKIIDVLQNYIIVLGTLSLQYMGVVPNPDGKLDTSGKKDLTQARVAIDTMALLFKQIESLVEKPVRDNIENLLDEVRLKFVDESARH